jgi:hypothetical protein
MKTALILLISTIAAFSAPTEKIFQIVDQTSIGPIVKEIVILNGKWVFTPNHKIKHIEKVKVTEQTPNGPVVRDIEIETYETIPGQRIAIPQYGKKDNIPTENILPGFILLPRNGEIESWRIGLKFKALCESTENKKPYKGEMIPMFKYFSFKPYFGLKK